MWRGRRQSLRPYGWGKSPIYNAARFRHHSETGGFGSGSTFREATTGKAPWFVGALWGGLPGSLIAAVLLATEQFAVHVIADLNPVRAAGSIIFFIVAAIVGWTFDRLRDYDRARRRVEGELAAEREAVAAHEARVAMVDTLHDSVLQTFHAIRMGADDPAQSRYLARRQERELRRRIEEWRSTHDPSYRAALLGMRDDMEDMHRVEIEAVIRDDAPPHAKSRSGDRDRP